MNDDRSPAGNRVGDDEPCYVISIAARMLGVHQQTLRYYERAGLVTPQRSSGNIRLYSRADLELIRRAQRLIDELGVNLAGVDVIFRMSRRIAELERRLAEAEQRLGRTPPQIAAPAESNPRA
ncbi:MAG TPA: helix-turn-helix transcriptional regulator [Dehalococcoidia bacterium]|nr:helix-turn-helix transcriptional regulator [Dehalococcoidia bacterium]